MKKQVQLTDITGKGHYIPLSNPLAASKQERANLALLTGLRAIDLLLVGYFQRDYNSRYTSYSAKELSSHLKLPYKAIYDSLGRLEKKKIVEGYSSYPRVFRLNPLNYEIRNLKLTNQHSQPLAQETEGVYES